MKLGASSFSRLLWLGASLLATARGAAPVCERTYNVVVPADGSLSVPFGVGDPHFAYDDGAEICWKVTSATGTAVTIALNSFETEFRHDFVTVYAGQGATAVKVGPSLSGELVSPYVIRIEAAGSATVRFAADDSLHPASHTQQLGFEAVAFDSSDEACLNNCSGPTQGACAAGVCMCSEGWGADVYTDCSIPVATLVDSVAVDLSGVKIGEWRYFKMTFEEAMGMVVELVDRSGANADPRLVISMDGLPTLSHYKFDDWFNWFYDCSDIHYLRSFVAAGTYYVGVTNDALRSEDDALAATLTLRVSAAGTLRCLLDCNGHGTCDETTGDCTCDAGWEGSYVNAPDTCQYEVQSLAYDALATGTVRIGDWAYYKVPEIAEDAAQTHSLMVEFVSSSAHAYPLVLARHGEVPRLAENFLPTYDAFEFDRGDKAGFEILSGQRYSILVNRTSLVAGNWFVGVYNIWGHNGAENRNSHDSVTYSIRASLYSAGTPCPSSGLEFCAGEPCDFNTGECTCPGNKLWRDCSFDAATLVPNSGAATPGALDVDTSEYYLVAVSQEDIDGGENIIVTLDVTSEAGAATPLLLARFGEMPFPGNLKQYDDHDLMSTFYRDARHEILVDADEMRAKGPGEWYFAVTNAERSTVLLTYTIRALKAASVACPRAHTALGATLEGATCSASGTCIGRLGRCDCDDGFVMDDCSADGVFHLANTNGVATAAQKPPIALDDWVFWSVVVGCGAKSLLVEFVTVNDAAAPLLVLRRDRLPLMVAGTFDYWDYYDGENGHTPRQSVRVTGCEDKTYGCSGGACCITPSYPGTIFADGAPEPGVYYVGVYNDAKIGTEAITEYSLRVDVDASTCGLDNCAEGFVGPNCDQACPGMMPSDVYSNTPVTPEPPCTDRGACSLTAAGAAVCACDAESAGEACEALCPLSCHDQGHCVLPAGEQLAEPRCECDDRYGGSNCLLSCAADDFCNDRGTCDFQTLRCACASGWTGAACEFECPKAEGASCSGHGLCDVVHSYSGAGKKAACECDANYHGDACDLACPRGEGFAGECSGMGACLVRGRAAKCECFQGYAGPACDQNATEFYKAQRDQGSKSSKGSSGGAPVALAAGLAVVAVVLLGCALGAWVVAERRKLQISRYERLVREVGATSSTVITRHSAAATPDDTTEDIFFDYDDSIGGAAASSYTAPQDIAPPPMTTTTSTRRSTSKPPPPPPPQQQGAPLTDQLELPLFGEMRDIGKQLSPFHDETLQL